MNLLSADAPVRRTRSTSFSGAVEKLKKERKKKKDKKEKDKDKSEYS